MSSGCGDVLSLEDLQTAKKHQTFEAEVITGKQGGVAGGADIDYATNQVTGQVQKTLPAVLRDAGFTPAPFTFQTGGTLSATDRNKVVYDSASLTWYSWAGTLPKVIAAGTNPLLDANWKPWTDPNLRNNLAASDGEKLIGEASNIAALRTIEPTYDKQRITLREHTAGTRKGGGQFRAVLAGTSYTDNNGTIVKTAGGAAWLRVNSDIVNPLMFGAVGNGVTDDSTAINSALASATKEITGAGLSYGVGSTVLQIQTVPTVFTDAKLIFLPALGTTPMMRRRHAAHIMKRVDFEGSQSTTNIGITWEGASQVLSRGVAGGLIEDCEFKSIGGSAINISADYTNLWFASYGRVSNCRFIDCGRIGTGTNNATIISNGVSNFSFEGLKMTGCNWGIYTRNDFNTAGVNRAGGNSVTNSIIRGSGSTFTASQGISASFQDGLRITGVTVSDFDDNAIDMQYCDNSIVSNWRTVACKDGVFMGDRHCKGHVISDGQALDCQRAIRLVTDGTIMAAAVMSNISINNVHAVNSKVHGFYIGRTGASTQMYNIRLSACSSDSTSSYTQSTFVTNLYIEGGTNITVSDFNTYTSKGNTIYVKTSDIVRIITGTHQNVDRAGSGAYAITVETDCTRVSVSDQTVYGSSTAGAVLLAGGLNHSVKHTRWRGVANGVSSSSATTPYLLDNQSF